MPFLRTVLMGSLLVGCPATESASDERSAVREGFERRAHREALAHARTSAEAALTAADPLAAWACCGGELAPPHLAPRTLARVREASRKAKREASDIDPTHLDPMDLVTLRVLEFGLQRLESRARDRPPSRTDPSWLVEGLRPLLDALEAEVAAESCTGCTSALERIVDEAAAAAYDLGAAAPAVLSAAIDDLEALALRCELLGTREEALDPAARGAASSLRRVVEQWRLQRAAMEDLPPLARNARVGPAEGRPALAKLPPRMGADELIALLEHEEASAEPIAGAIEQLGRVIVRLRAMADVTAPADRTNPAPVSAERCESARARLHAWAAQSIPVPADAPDCAPLVRGLEGRALDDAELVLHVIRRAWIEPLARSHRRDTGALVALVEGRIAPASHGLAASIAAATGIGDPAASRLAIEQALHGACAAATTLWVHAEHDDDERLIALLEKHCPARAPAAWIEDALARPRRSLEGLGLAFVEPGPAALAALERYSWAPLGLVPVLAEPQRLMGGDPVPLDVSFEQLGN